MHQLLTSRVLLIDSSKCPASDGTCDFGVNMQSDCIACAEDEVLTLTLTHFSVYYSWPWVPKNTSLTVELNEIPHVVQLPSGHPTLADLALSITSSVNDKSAAAQSTSQLFRCTFNKAGNTLVFTKASTLIDVTFPDQATATLLGFAQTTTTGLGTVESGIVKPLPLDSIRLHITGVNPDGLGHNMTNMAGKLMQFTNCLGEVLVDARPYTWLTGNGFFMALADRSLGQLRFWLSDGHDNPLHDLPHCKLQLRIDKHKRVDEALAPLSDVALSCKMMASLDLARAADGL